MKADIVSTVEHATVGLANPQYKPAVKLNGFTPYGIDGTIYAFAKNDLLLSTMADAVAQSIAHADYLEEELACATQRTQHKLCRQQKGRPGTYPRPAFIIRATAAIGTD